jgi:capsid portal protein
VQNAGRVAVLEEGDFTPLSYTQKDMQFVESRGLTRQAVFDAYGFPKFGIGDVDDVNRASAEASMALMAQTLTVPRLEDIRGVLNGRLLPMFGPLWRDYEFNYRSPIPPDAESERLDLAARTTAFKTLIDARVDPSDAAEVCGLPPMNVREPEPAPAPAPAAPPVPPAGE